MPPTNTNASSRASGIVTFVTTSDTSVCSQLTAMSSNDRAAIAIPMICLGASPPDPPAVVGDDMRAGCHA